MIDSKTGQKIPGFLRNLKLAELSGCGRGANQHARVVLVKNADGAIAKKYATVDDLPSAIKDNLPKEAQQVFMRVANAQLEKDPGNDKSAFAVAWTAVKNGWQKDDKGVWVKKRELTQEERDAAATSGAAMSDGSYPIKTKEDLKNAIQSFGRAKNPDAVKAHIKARAKALGAEDALPEDWVKKAWITDKLVDDIAKQFYGGPVSLDGDSSDAGAQSFNDLLDEREEQQARWEANEEIWPLFSALQDSIQSIVADDNVGADAKMPLIRQSVEQFMMAMGDAVPNAVEELSKLLKSIPALAGVSVPDDQTGSHVPANKEIDMATDDTKKVADLEQKIADLTKGLDEANKQIAALTKTNGELTTAKTAAETELASMKTAAEVAKTDEVIAISVADPADATKTVVKEIRKSVVGEQNFLFMKTQQAELKKERSEREEIVFAKRAETEIGNLPGDSKMLGKVLKAAEDISDKDVREATLAALKAGSGALKKSFTVLGKDGAGKDGDAADKLDAMARKYAEDNKVNFAKAYDIVIQSNEGRKLYAESLGQAA